VILTFDHKAVSEVLCSELDRGYMKSKTFAKNVLELSTSRGYAVARGCKNFYFTCNHLLSSTCVQRAETFAKMF